MNSADTPSSPPASPRAVRQPAASPGFAARAAPWLLIVTLVILGLWLGQLYLMVRAENALLRDQLRLTELELRSERQRAEAERILAQRELADLREKPGSR